MSKQSLTDEIRKESLIFVKENKGSILEKTTNYLSPRITSEFMDCSMPMTFDQYSFCSLGCVYCFAYMFKSNNMYFNTKLHSVETDKFVETIHGKPNGVRNKAFHRHFLEKRFVLHWGGLADPFCNFEKANWSGFKIVEALAEEKYPTIFSFKGSAIFRPKFMNLFENSAKNKNFAFQTSIVTNSDKMSRLVEVGAPVTTRRIEAIKVLSDLGYYTILRLRPYIIGVTDEGIDDLLHRCLEAGIKAVSMEFFALDCRSNENLMQRYKWLGELIGTKNVTEYFKKLSPNERGGYKRLNRLVKESHVKTVYKFCVDNGILFACSDPDFKELNMSGSCCGLPDVYPENKELQNWTKNQMTYHLKDARIKYHTRGRSMKFSFDRIFKDKIDTYLGDNFFANDHPMVKDLTATERKTLTYLEIARRVWNNLRSPSNPRNYFHGKMMPVMVDGNENLVYLYTPSSYERRWAKEGIDLTV